MPSFIDTIFGRKKPTSATAADAVASLEAELQAVPARIEKAQETLKRVADLSDEQHAAAEAELAAARRAEARLGAQIEQLHAALAQAVHAEAATALRVQVAAVQKRVDKEYMPLIEQYEAKAAEITVIVDALEAIDREVNTANYAIELARKADRSGSHPDPIANTTERFRSQPATVDPDTTIVEEIWQEPDPITDRWRGLGVYGTDASGSPRPQNPAARKRTVKRVIPGRTRRGRSISSPARGLRLPAARLDQPAFWPRPE